MDVNTMAKRGNRQSIKNRSVAEFLAWTLSGGPKRKKDLQLTTLEYFARGRALANDLPLRLTRAGLPVEDGDVYIIANDPDRAKPHGEFHKFKYPANGAEELEAAVTFHQRGYAIIGLVVSIWDREKTQRLVFARPFIVSNPAVARLLDHALKHVLWGTVEVAQ